MEELSERPPVPPEERGGDERIGWWITGTLLLLVGWVGGVAANLALHRLAPASGWRIGPWWIGPTMGPYAWAVFGFGVAVGLFGLVLYGLARNAPRGKIVLPGYPY